MKNDENDNLKELLYSLASVVVSIEEHSEDYSVEEMRRVSQKHLDELFRQMNKKIEVCENEEQSDFVYQTTLTFIIEALTRLCDVLYRKDKLKPGFGKSILSGIENRFIEIEEE